MQRITAVLALTASAWFTPAATAAAPLAILTNHLGYDLQGPKRGVLQGHVARELRLRRTPHLLFAYDPSVERGVRMTKLIEELAPAEPDDGADDETG